MNLQHSLLLGIVQGLTEFIPVSSTAHLILVPQFVPMEEPSHAFDVALHFGTLLAILRVRRARKHLPAPPHF